MDLTDSICKTDIPKLQWKPIIKTISQTAQGFSRLTRLSDYLMSDDFDS